MLLCVCSSSLSILACTSITPITHKKEDSTAPSLSTRGKPVVSISSKKTQSNILAADSGSSVSTRRKVKSGKKSASDSNGKKSACDSSSTPSKCVVSEKFIEDSREDSIECEGACKEWLHRVCAGMSRAVFNEFKLSPDPFYCPYCMKLKHSSFKLQIEELKVQLEDLKVLNKSIVNQPTLADATAHERSECLYSEIASHSVPVHSRELIQQLRPILPQTSESLIL